jgi:hypothetical protein
LEFYALLVRSTGDWSKYFSELSKILSVGKDDLRKTIASATRTRALFNSMLSALVDTPEGDNEEPPCFRGSSMSTLEKLELNLGQAWRKFLLGNLDEAWEIAWPDVLLLKKIETGKKEIFRRYIRLFAERGDFEQAFDLADYAKEKFGIEINVNYYIALSLYNDERYDELAKMGVDMSAQDMLQASVRLFSLVFLKLNSPESTVNFIVKAPLASEIKSDLLAEMGLICFAKNDNTAPQNLLAKASTFNGSRFTVQLLSQLLGVGGYSINSNQNNKSDEMKRLSFYSALAQLILLRKGEMAGNVSGVIFLDETYADVDGFSSLLYKFILKDSLGVGGYISSLYLRDEGARGINDVFKKLRSIFPVSSTVDSMEFDSIPADRQLRRRSDSWLSHLLSDV